MTIKMLAAALALAVSPIVAMAGCSTHAEQQAMTCADGTVYDPATSTCKVVSG